MAKVATSEQTSGSGFDFEDKVTVYFLANMLAERLPLSEDVGLLQKVEFQTRAKGWLLDDFLFSFQDREVARKVAVSSKRNRQITGSGLPDPILKDVWDQFLGITAQVFDPNTDYLMFIVSPLGRSVADNLDKIINAARHSDPADMVERMKTGNFSQPQRKLFESFDCPEEWKTKYNITEEDICRLLSRIIIKEFDFKSNASASVTATIGILQDCLESKSSSEAAALNEKLCSLRMKYAQHIGYIDYPLLVKNIIRQFRLSGFPSHTSDWRNLTAVCNHKSGNIPDTAGGRLHFDRKAELEKITSTLRTKQVLFLTGTSGSGKTVLAKLLYDEIIAKGGQVIWVDPEILQHGNLENYFGIRHALTEMVGKSRGAHDLLIVDGADRIYKPALFDPLVSLIREVIAAENGNWNVVLTCQQDDYEDLIQRFQRKNLAFTDADLYTVPLISEKELLRAVESFPAFGELLKHDHLWPLLDNLKFLDIVLFHIASFNPSQFEQGIGESHLIDWIWKQEVLNNGENGDANARFLLRLSELQANDLQLFTPLTAFAVAESAPVTELKRNKIISENEDRLFFTHDLFGDWARYKIIRANQDRIHNYLPELDLFSPLWSKAIRLYGIYLLEREHGATQWLNVYSGFDKAQNGKVIQHLLLESIIYANDAEKYLTDLWVEFKKDEAKVLNAFLERFLFKATVPNTHVLKLVGKLQGISVSQLATFHRIPKFAYWFPVLAFIERHFEEFLEIARPHAIKIAGMWLENMPAGAIYRPLAARMGLQIGMYMAEFKANGGFAMDHVGKEFFKPMLLAAPELPEEVIALCLKLSGRTGELKEKDRGGRQMSYNPRLGIEFPDGPKVTADRDFEEACLEGRNLVPLIRKDARAAKEILLALMIDAPQDLATMDRHDYKLDINEVTGWYPPFYTRGPFLAFQQNSPTEAIDFVIRLLNLTADNWRKFRKYHKEEEDTIILRLMDGQERAFYGDQQVYFWYRDIGTAPDSLVSVLMALEKFLIDEIDKAQDISKYLNTIISQGKSLALLGVLSSIGRYSPGLLLTELSPLLRIVEFYEWENSLDYDVRSIEGMQMTGASLFDSTTYEQAKQWNSMPHRKRSIKMAGLSLLIGRPENEEFFRQEIIPAWKEYNQKINQQGYTYTLLDTMIAQFDPENYHPFQNETHSGLIYNEPEEVTEKLAEIRSVPDPDSDDFIFSFTKERELDNKTEYSVKELDSLWIKVQGFYARPEGKIFDNLNHRLANIFSGLAILMRHRDLWESQHPEIIPWALLRIEEVLNQFVFDFRSSTMLSTPGNWKKFCQQILVDLFAENHEDKTIRKFLGSLLLHSDNETASLIFSSLLKHFALNDPAVIQLINLFIRRSAVIQQQPFRGWDTPTDWKAEFGPLLDDYINSRIGGEPEDFSVFIPVGTGEQDDEEQYRNRSRRFGKDMAELRETGLELELIYQPYSFPEWGDIADDRQKAYVIECYKRLIHLRTFSWGDITDDFQVLDIDLRGFDYWLIHRLTRLLPKISDQQVRELWEPLFSYGNLAGKWLISFMDSMLVNNYQTPENFPAIGVIWNQIISFAKNSPTWKYKDHYYRDHADLWDTLMGLSNTGMSIWQAGYSDLLLLIRDALFTWLIPRFTYTEGVNKMAILLRSPSALNFLDIGILILDGHLRYQVEIDKTGPPEGMVRVKFEHYDSIANTAGYLWENHKNELTGNDKVMTAYKNILLHLVAVQNPIGLELQDRLISE